MKKKEFLEPWRLRSIIGKYSDHISLPVEMEKVEMDNENEDAEKEADGGSGPWNSKQWIKRLHFGPEAKSEIDEEEYKEFLQAYLPWLWRPVNLGAQ